MSIPGYEILSLRGPTGEARQRSTGRLVRLEQYDGFGPYGTHDVQDRLQRRLEAATLLEHPHILSVLAVGRVEGRLYLVRPLVQAVSLTEHLAGAALEAKQAARWVRQAAEALHHAHEHGIFRLNLATNDVLVDERGELLLAGVDDVQVRFLHPPEPPPDSAAVIAGIPGQMAPEQIRGEPNSACPRRDVWGLGVLLYHLAVGRPPFQAPTTIEVLRATLLDEVPRPRSLRPDVDPDLETILLRCLRKEPQQRYPDVAALLGDLGAYLDGRPLPAGEQPSLGARVGRWLKGWWPART